MLTCRMLQPACRLSLEFLHLFTTSVGVGESKSALLVPLVPRESCEIWCEGDGEPKKLSEREGRLHTEQNQLSSLLARVE